MIIQLKGQNCFWIKKQNRWAIYYRPNLNIKTQSFKEKRMDKKICHANTDQKKAGLAILVSDNKDFRGRNISRDEKETFHNDKNVNSHKIKESSICTHLIIYNVSLSGEKCSIVSIYAKQS